MRNESNRRTPLSLKQLGASGSDVYQTVGWGNKIGGGENPRMQQTRESEGFPGEKLEREAGEDA